MTSLYHMLAFVVMKTEMAIFRRLPKDCTELELCILPLQPDAPIYLPREADRTAGEAVTNIEIINMQ